MKGSFEAVHRPYEQRELLLAGFEEGKIRFYFGGSDPKGGVDGRPFAPPPLVREGERVRSEWLFKFLLHVDPIRSWLKVRMPSFYLTDEEARLLVDWFKANTGVPEANETFAADTLAPELAEKGQALFGPPVGDRVGFQCNGCHPAGTKLPTVPTFNPPSKFDYTKFGFEVPDDKHYVVWKEGPTFGRQLGFADAAAAEAWAKQNVARKDYAIGERSSGGPISGRPRAGCAPRGSTTGSAIPTTSCRAPTCRTTSASDTPFAGCTTATRRILPPPRRWLRTS
jgi:mono/diheme cytochrome c family protein